MVLSDFLHRRRLGLPEDVSTTSTGMVQPLDNRCLIPFPGSWHESQLQELTENL